MSILYKKGPLGYFLIADQDQSKLKFVCKMEVS